MSLQLNPARVRELLRASFPANPVDAAAEQNRIAARRNMRELIRRRYAQGLTARGTAPKYRRYPRPVLG